MFSAIILGCSLTTSGEADTNNCMAFMSPIVWENLEQCMNALAAGIPYAESQGWYVKDYECYNWEEKKGTAL